MRLYAPHLSKITKVPCRINFWISESRESASLFVGFGSMKIFFHIKSVHEKKKRYSCEVCQKEFTLKGNLDKHAKTIHNQEWIQCQLCDKAFTQNKNLMDHIRRIHSKDKSHNSSWKESNLEVSSGMKQRHCGRYFSQIESKYWICFGQFLKQ